MKKVIFSFHFAIAILMHNALHGMEAAETPRAKFDKACKALEHRTKEGLTKKELEQAIVLGAHFFISAETSRKTGDPEDSEDIAVPLVDHIHFHEPVKDIYRQLAKKRKGGTCSVDAKLLGKFKKAVEKSSESDKESSKRVVTLGAKLLARGAPFEEIHTPMKAAGNILRGNTK